MRLLVAIQHRLTNEQLEELKLLGFTNVKTLEEANPPLFKALSNTPSSEGELDKLATELAQTSANFDAVVLPIGSPAFNFLISRKLNNKGVLFAHSERVSIEEPNEDGSIIKKSVFKHIKFIKFDV